MSTYYLTHKTLPKDGIATIRQNIGCCAGMGWSSLSRFQYLSPIRASITDAHVAFWVRLLRKMLVCEDISWTYEIVESTEVFGNEGHKTRCILWTMETLSKRRTHNLLYLSAFRYPEENPVVVERLFAKRAEAEGPDDMFKLLQSTCHGANGSDRSLIRSARDYGNSSNTPVSLARYLSNLANPRTSSVQAHFA